MDKDKPNIVLFMVDQLSAKWLEAASDGVCEIPNLKRFMKEGVTFKNTITSNPVCSPARATIATGLTSRGHGVLENGYQLDPKLPTFMKKLQDNKWKTGAFGKLHFSPHFAGLYPEYKQYGFDVTHITEDARGGEWVDFIQKEYPEYFEDALATVWPKNIPEFSEYGKDKIDLNTKINKIRDTYNWCSDKYPHATRGAYVLPFPKEISQTEWITRNAEEFIGNLSEDEAFFAHISYVQPHTPSCPPEEYLDKVNEALIPEPLEKEWVTDKDAPKYFDRCKKLDFPKWKFKRKCYFADIVHLDEQFGRIINVLEKTNRIDNTYIIFVADHGELLCDHGFGGKEERHYDACIRIPLIIGGPGIEKGLISEEMIQLEDICPTILDIVNLRMDFMPKMGHYLNVLPEEIPVLPGKSLIPLCKGEKINWRQAAYVESYNSIGSMNVGDWARTIRTKKYRYTRYANGNGEQMFDMEKDPDEQNNIINDPNYKEVKNQLKDELMEMIILQDYPKTRRNLYALGVH